MLNNFFAGRGPIRDQLIAASLKLGGTLSGVCPEFSGLDGSGTFVRTQNRESAGSVCSLNSAEQNEVASFERLCSKWQEF